MDPAIFPTRVLARCDVLVIGADTTGVAAALAAVEQGRTVVLVERRIYPVADIAGTLDLVPPEPEIDLLCRGLGLHSLAVRPVSGGAALHPRRLKTAVEDRLVDAGVVLFYGLIPFAWRTSHPLIHVAVASKGGAFAIEAAACVDASTEGIFVPAFAARDWLEPSQPVLRRLEFFGVDQVKLEAQRLQGSEGTWSWLTGPAGARHVFVDVPVPTPESGEQSLDGTSTCDAAYSAATWLAANEPAFANSRLCAVAECALHAPRWRLNGSAGIPPWFFPVNNAANNEGGLAGDTFGARIDRGRAVGRSAAVCPGAVAPGAGNLPVSVRHTDVLVVGGGTCGANAAIAAAEAGSETLVAELNPALGGIGTVGGINSYWFSYRARYNVGFTETVHNDQSAVGYKAMPHRRIRTWNIEQNKWILRDSTTRAGVAVLFECMAVAAIKGEGCVTGAWLALPGSLIRAESGVCIDATGDGDFAEIAGVNYTYGDARSGWTLPFTLSPVTTPGTTCSSFTGNVDVRSPADYTRAIMSGRRQAAAPQDFSERDYPYDHAAYIETREARHIHGEVTLTLTDQLRMRRWPDTIALVFSNPDVTGHTESDWVRLGLIAPNIEIEIPYRALVPAGVDGLLVTGKAFSTTSDGLAAIRMQADFEDLGYATGIAAAEIVRQLCPARSLDVRCVQERLIAIGNLPPRVLRPRTPHPGAGRPLAGYIAALDDSRPLPLNQDTEKGVAHRNPLPFIEICEAEQGAAVRLLRAELHIKNSPRQTMAALALAWFQRREAAPALRAAICAHLGGTALPARLHPIHRPPAQGSMPELACLLHAYALTRDPAGVELIETLRLKLDPTEEGLRSSTAGLFDYMDCICDIAERLGDPRCETTLGQLAAVPLWSGMVSRGPYQSDWHQERKAFLEILIARARARCGIPAGVRTLIHYLEDSRQPLVDHAHSELQRITGLSLGTDAQTWTRWHATCQHLRPAPWRGRTARHGQSQRGFAQRPGTNVSSQRTIGLPSSHVTGSQM